MITTAKAELPGTPTQKLEEDFSTDAVGADQALALWRQRVRHTCGSVRVVADGAVFRHGAIRTVRLAVADLASISADPHAIVRSRCEDPQGYVYFCRLLAGMAVLAQDGREAVVGPGDMVCFDSRRPFALTMPEPFAMVLIRVPHKRMRLRVADTTSVTARRWSCASGVAAVVGNALSSLNRHCRNLQPDMAECLGVGFINLVGLLLAEHIDEPAGDTELARRALLERVKEYAATRLGDPDLRPRTLARQHHVSVRYLQQLFADIGTSPARWIREERLRRCHSDLCDPAMLRLTVAAIGERWGLPNASHFSRQFRDHYGITPRELRDRMSTAAA